MPMVSMKKDPREEMADEMQPESMDEPMYPYGLKICLDDDTLKTLGITMPIVGQKYEIVAFAECVSASAEKVQEGSQEVRGELQITDMQLTPAAGDPAKSLWPDKE